MTKSLHETMLQYAKELSFPLEAVTQKFAIMGQSGGGKTYDAMKLAELMLEVGAQIVVADIPGVWKGLRSSADGKSPGYKVLLVGGEDGDLPINASSGALIADMVVDTRLSVILDLSEMEDDDMLKFMIAFTAQLFKRKKSPAFRDPMHLFLEECQELIPQELENGLQKLLRAKLVRMMKIGRNYGIGWSAITQEPQAASKRAINQAGTIIAVRTMGGHERKALEAWARSKTRSKEQLALMDVLPELEQGQALVWSPGWLKYAGIVNILPKITFDSSATPKMGERKVKARVIAELDLVKLKSDMASMIQEAEAFDPVKLQGRAVRAETDLRDALKLIDKLKAAAPVAAPGKLKTVQEKVVLKKDAQALASTVSRMDTWAEKMAKLHADLIVSFAPMADSMRKLVADLTGPLESARLVEAPKARVVVEESLPRVSFTKPPAPAQPQPAWFDRTSMARTVEKYAAKPGESAIGKGERAVLTAVAQYADAGVTREQLTILTGYKRSTRDAYLQRLTAAQMVAQRGDEIVATAVAFDLLGTDFQPLPTGTALRDHWLRELPEGERRVLGVLVNAYPAAVERDTIGEGTGYKRSTRDAYLQRLGTRKLVTDSRDGMRASDMLFDGARA